MRLLKRSVGVLILLLGSVGTLASLAGLAGTWVVRAKVYGVVSNVVDRVDVALSKLEDRTNQANERIETVRDSCRSLNEGVQQRVAELRDIPTEEAPDIDEIERQLYARIQLGRDHIEFLRTSVDLVEQFFQILDSIAVFSKDESKTRGDLVAVVEAGHDQIEEAFKLAEQVGIHLSDIRDHRNLEENASKIQTLSSRIDASLESVQDFGLELEAGIAQIRSDVGNLGTRILRQVLIVAVLASLLLLWLVASQVSLAIHGWRPVRS